jgi:Domain of unknown function (DUF4129)
MMAAQDQVDQEAAARQLDDAHRQLLGDNSIQFDLPPAGDASAQPLPQSYAPNPPPPPPQASPDVPVDPSSAPPASAPSDIQIGGGGGGVEGVMQVFLWVAAAIALAIILYWIFAYFRDRGVDEAKPKKQRKGKERAEWRPEEAEAVQLLDEADVLAQQGRYDEAARLLLHRSIGEIDAHRPDLVRPALTSRDIARHPLLPGGPAAAFARIAALVERSLFARRPLDADDWQNCRAAYHDFAFAEGWGG